MKSSCLESQNKTQLHQYRTLKRAEMHAPPPKSRFTNFAATAAAKSLQSCLTLWDPIDCSPPGSPIPGILQARILEWVAISFSSAWKWKVKGKSLGRVWLLATPRTASYQAPLPMGFSRQEYWSGVPLPSPLLILVAYNFSMHQQRSTGSQKT